jgi:hypothetical protein
MNGNSAAQERFGASLVTRPCAFAQADAGALRRKLGALTDEVGRYHATPTPDPDPDPSDTDPRTPGALRSSDMVSHLSSAAIR